MEIKPLLDEVRSQLRSGTSNINDIPHCVMELVFNSLDANASSIAVRINILTFRLQIVDNGCGVTKSNFEKIAERYMSSKCHSLKDYNKHPKYYGYRGESLASIRHNCGKLTIASRAYKCTYSKGFEGGNCGDVIEISHRPSEGTTVTVEDFLKNLPVRKNRVNSELDLDGVKGVLASLAIIHPSVKFSLRNDITKKTVFQNVSSETVEEAFLKVHDDIDPAHLSQLKITKGKVSIVGLIYKKVLQVNKYQYVYVNKRPIHITPLGGVIQDVFSNSTVCKDFQNGQHFGYILNIRCPHACVHYTTSSAKTTAEFSNWDVIAKCVERVIINCLEKGGLVNDKLPVIIQNICKEDKRFNLMDIDGVVMAKATKTKGYENVKVRDKHSETSKCDQIENKVQNKNMMIKATKTKRIKGSDKNSADTTGDKMKTKVQNKTKATKTKRCENGSNKSSGSTKINELENKIQNIRVAKKSLNKVRGKGNKLVDTQSKKGNNNCNKISSSGSSKIAKSDYQIINSGNNNKISPKRKQSLRLYDCSFRKFKKARKINNTTKRQLLKKVPLMYDVMADANSVHTSEDIKIDEYPESNDNDINNQTLGKAIILNKFLISVELQGDEPDDSLYEEEQLERKSTVSISCRIKSRGKHKRISSERISNVSYTRRIHRKRRRRSELPDDTIEAVEMVSKCMQTTLIMDQILPTDQIESELEGTVSEHKQLERRDLINTRSSNYKPLKSMGLNDTCDDSDVQFTTNLTVDLDGSVDLHQGPNLESNIVSKGKANEISNIKALDRPLEDVSFSVYFPRPNKQPNGLSKRQSYESSNIEPPKDLNVLDQAEETFSGYFPHSHKQSNIISKRQSKIELPKDLNQTEEAFSDYFPRPNNVSESRNNFSKPISVGTLDFQTGLVDDETKSQYFSCTNEKKKVPFGEQISSNYKTGQSVLYRIKNATNVHKEKHEKKTVNKPLRGILKNKIIKGPEKMILGPHITTPVTGIFFPIKKHSLDLSGIFKKPRTDIKDTTNKHFRKNTRIFGNRNHKSQTVHERNLNAPISEYIFKGNIKSKTVSEKKPNSCNANIFGKYSKEVDSNDVQKRQTVSEKVPNANNDIFGTYINDIESTDFQRSEITKNVDEIISNIYKNLPLGNYRKDYWEAIEKRKREQVADGNQVFDFNPSATIRKPSILYDPAYEIKIFDNDYRQHHHQLFDNNNYKEIIRTNKSIPRDERALHYKPQCKDLVFQKDDLQRKEKFSQLDSERKWYHNKLSAKEFDNKNANNLINFPSNVNDLNFTITPNIRNSCFGGSISSFRNFPNNVNDLDALNFTISPDMNNCLDRNYIWDNNHEYNITRPLFKLSKETQGQYVTRNPPPTDNLMYESYHNHKYLDTGNVNKQLRNYGDANQMYSKDKVKCLCANDRNRDLAFNNVKPIRFATTKTDQDYKKYTINKKRYDTDTINTTELHLASKKSHDNVLENRGFQPMSLQNRESYKSCNADGFKVMYDVPALFDGASLEDKIQKKFQFPSAKCGRDYNEEVLMKTMACEDGNFINCNSENNKQHNIIDVPIRRKHKVPTRKRDLEYNDELLMHINCEANRRTAKDYSDRNYKDMCRCGKTNDDINDRTEEHKNNKPMQFPNRKTNEDINDHIEENQNYRDMRFSNRKTSEDIDYIKRHQNCKEMRSPNRKINEDIDEHTNYKQMRFPSRSNNHHIIDHIEDHHNYKENPYRKTIDNINNHIDELQNCKEMGFSNRRTYTDLNDQIDEHQNYKDMRFPNRKPNKDINEDIEHKTYKEMRFPRKTTNEYINEHIEDHQYYKEMRFTNRKTIHNINDDIDQNSKAMPVSNIRTNKDLNDYIDEHNNYKNMRFPNRKINEDINDHIDEYKNNYKDMQFPSKTTNEDINDHIEDLQNYKEMHFPNRKTIDNINDHIDKHQTCKEMRFSIRRTNKDLNVHINDHQNYKDMRFTNRKTNDHIKEHQNCKEMYFGNRKTNDDINNHLEKHQDMRFPNRKTSEDVNDHVEEHQNYKEMYFGNRKTNDDINNYLEKHQDIRFPNGKTSEDVNAQVEKPQNYKEIPFPNSVVVQPLEKQILYTNEKICHENSHAANKTYTNYNGGRNDINQKLIKHFARTNTHQGYNNEKLNIMNNKSLRLACGKTLDNNIDDVFVNKNHEYKKHDEHFRMRRNYEGYNVLGDSNYNQMRCPNRKNLAGAILKDTIQKKIQFPSVKHDQVCTDGMLMETNQESMHLLGRKHDEDDCDEIMDKVNMKQDNMNFPCENNSHCEIQNKNSKAMRFKNDNAEVSKRTNQMNLIQRNIPSTYINEDCTRDIFEAINQETMSLPRKTCEIFDGGYFEKQESMQFPHRKGYEENRDRVLENEYHKEENLPSIKVYDYNDGALQEKHHELMHFPNEKAYQEIFSNDPIETGYRDCEVTKRNTKAFLQENIVYKTMQFTNEIVEEEHNATHNCQQVEFPCRYVYENGNDKKTSNPHTIRENTKEILNSRNHKPKSTFAMNTYEDVNKSMQISSIKTSSRYKNEVLGNVGHKPMHYGHANETILNDNRLQISMNHCDKFNKPIVDDAMIDDESFSDEHRNNEVKNINSKDDRVDSEKEINVNKNSDIHRNCSNNIQDGYNNARTNKLRFGSRNIETINFDASNGKEQLPDISFVSNNCFTSKLTSTDFQTNCVPHIGNQFNASIVTSTKPNYDLKSTFNTEVMNSDALNRNKITPAISYEINKSMGNCFSSKLTSNQRNCDQDSKIGTELINPSIVKVTQTNSDLKAIFGSVNNELITVDASNGNELSPDISFEINKSKGNYFSSKLTFNQKNCDHKSNIGTEINTSTIRPAHCNYDLKSIFGSQFDASNEKEELLEISPNNKSMEKWFSSKLISNQRNCDLPYKIKTELINPSIFNDTQPKSDLKAIFGSINTAQNYFDAPNGQTQSPENLFDTKKSRNRFSSKITISGNENPKLKNIANDKCRFNPNNRNGITPEISFDDQMLQTTEHMSVCLSVQDLNKDYQKHIDMTLDSENNDFIGAELNTQAKHDSKLNCSDDENDEVNYRQGINLKTKWNRCDSKQDEANNRQITNLKTKLNRKGSKHDNANNCEDVSLQTKSNRSDFKQIETNNGQGINLKTKLNTNDSKQMEANHPQGIHLKTKLNFNDSKQDETNKHKGINVKTKLNSYDSKQDEANNRQGINVKTKLFSNDSKLDEANNRQGINVKTNLISHDFKKDEANNRQGIKVKTKLNSDYSKRDEENNRQGINMKTKLNSNNSKQDEANSSMNDFWPNDFLDSKKSTKCGKAKTNDFSFDTKAFLIKSNNNKMFHTFGNKNDELDCKKFETPDSHFSFDTDEFMKKSFDMDFYSLGKNSEYDDKFDFDDEKSGSYVNKLELKKTAKENSNKPIKNNTNTNNKIPHKIKNGKSTVIDLATNTIIKDKIAKQDNAIHILSNIIVHRPLESTEETLNFNKPGNSIASDHIRKDVKRKSLLKLLTSPIRTDKPSNTKSKSVSTKIDGGIVDYNFPKKSQDQYIASNQCQQEVILVRSKLSQDQAGTKNDRCDKQDFLQVCSKKSLGQAVSRSDKCHEAVLNNENGGHVNIEVYNQNQAVLDAPKIKLPIYPTQESNVSKTKLVNTSNCNPFDSGTIANIDYDLPNKAPSQYFEGPNEEICFNLDEGGDYAARLKSQIEKYECTSSDISFNLTNENDGKQDAYLSDSYVIDMLQSCRRSPDWIAHLDANGKMFYVHKITGTTTSKRPNDGEKFNMKKRITAMPKGCSPMLSGKEIIETSMSQSGKKTLYDAIMQQYEEELGTIKWTNIHKTGVDPRRFFDPIFDNYKTKIAADIPDISKKGLSKFGKADTCLNEMTFTRDIFNGLLVIGQLDKKFIVGLAADKSLLLLFDQHAVHERVRVEKLQNDYKMGRDEVIEFKTTQLNKYCTINATEEEINMMSMYREVFETIGLKYIIVDGAILQILEAPTCIYNKYSKNKDDDNLVQLLKCLIEELVETLQITRGTVSTVPKVIQNVINMEACRGAVMFGDVLTINECRNHLKALSMCKLPFQCAHGRPTMTPLIELKQLETN